MNEAHCSNCSDEKIILALKKAQSHIGKVIEMVEAGDYCIDVIQQINAVEGYLRSAKTKKLDEHLHTCFANGMAAKNEKRKNELIAEVLKVTSMSKN